MKCPPEQPEPRVIGVTRDGREGLPEHGPYDVIHVGGAIEAVSDVLLDQLAPGGRMWAPVDSTFAQAIYVYHRNPETLVIEKEKLFDVMYGRLTSIEDQLTGT